VKGKGKNGKAETAAVPQAAATTSRTSTTAPGPLKSPRSKRVEGLTGAAGFVLIPRRSVGAQGPRSTPLTQLS
jgi:hypothetical protein